MKTAIILHGMPTKEEYFNPESPAQSNKHWLPWIQRQLILKSVLAQTPEWPDPYQPDYAKWRGLFEQFPVDEQTTLIGHSCGAGFLVRWLSENKIKVGKVALVAPWINPKSPRVTAGFFNFEIDGSMRDRTNGIALFISSDDGQEELATAAQLKNTIRGLEVREFSDHGHFTMSDMKTEQFPELRNWILGS